MTARELLAEISQLKRDAEKSSGDNWYTVDQRIVFGDVATLLFQATERLQRAMQPAESEAAHV